jgi:N-methylhydantoinase A
VLGRIIAEKFLGGSMKIFPERAQESIEKLGRQLGLNASEAAAAIVRVANSNMEAAIRAVTLEKGQDPRDFPLIAFGGCGGLHACEIAEELGIQTVIFPPWAGALSAVGMLLAMRTRDYAAGAIGCADIDSLFAMLATRAHAELPGSQLALHADIRYAGQSYELTVPWDTTNPRRTFEAEYQKIYGFLDPSRDIEIVTARVRAVLPSNTPLPQGDAQLFDYGSTAFVPPGWHAHRNEAGVIVARPASSGDLRPASAV